MDLSGFLLGFIIGTFRVEIWAIIVKWWNNKPVRKTQ